MTGNPVPALNLHVGDVIHLEPHRVGSATVGHTADVLLAHEPRAEGRYVVLDCEGDPRLLGGSASTWWAVVYEEQTPVVVIGHRRAA